MPYYFKKGKNTTETKKKSVHGMEKMLCQKWFAKFCAGDFSLDDAPWWGRPVEVDSDQIETLIENNQSYTTWKPTYSNIQINKVIGENEKRVSYFTEKKNALFGQHNISNT